MLSSPPPGPAPDSAAASDADLVAAVAARDREAFVALFDRYAGRIKAFALRRGANVADADEIAQDVMVAIWRRAGTFDPERAAASTWIFAIARHRRIDLIRRAGRAAPDPLDPLFQPEAEPDAFDALDAAEREERLREALAALPPEQRAVLVAAFYEGLSHAEIAARERLEHLAGGARQDHRVGVAPGGADRAAGVADHRVPAVVRLGHVAPPDLDHRHWLAHPHAPLAMSSPSMPDSRRKARRIRDLTVPSGRCSRAAISAWLNPS